MKVLIIGGTGTIGKAVANELKPRHTVVTAGHQKGDVQVDMADPNSIRHMFEQTGTVDAIVSAAGNLHFGPLDAMTPALFDVGLKSKLLGQVNLVLVGREFVNDKGSFTLTSGSLSEDPVLYGSSASMVNAAVDGFVLAAAIELPRGLRINSVSPTVLAESMAQYGPYFRGFKPVPAVIVALAYSKSVEGHQTGQIYRVH